MFLNAIVRIPSRSMVEGISSANLGKPDYEKALAQHESYVAALSKAGLKLHILPPNEKYPDSCFIEDAALCTQKCVILTRPGAASRREESSLEDLQSMLCSLFSNIEKIEAPGTLEAGDVMMVGGHFYIGLSERTNEAGARGLIDILSHYGYSGEMVSLNEVLHLKTGLAYLERNVLLVAGEFATKPQFKQFNRIEIKKEHSYAANCIAVNDYIIVPKGFCEVRAQIEHRGFKTLEVDVSEFRKLDGGLSCLSLRF